MALAPTSSHGSTATGGATLLFDSTVAGADVATIDTGAAGIAAGYALLEVIVYGRTDAAGTTGDFLLRFNADSGNNYDRQLLYATNTTVSGVAGAAGSGWFGMIAGNGAAANFAGVTRFLIPSYDGTTFYKAGNWQDGYAESATTNSITRTTTGSWRNTAAITRVSATGNSAAKFKIGSRMTIFGYS